MNLEKLLNYQKKDEELFKVEQKLYNSPYRKKANELAQIAKKAQAKSTELEKEAEKLIAELSELKEKFAVNKEKSEEILATDFEKLSLEEIEKLSGLKSKVFSNFNILEKMLQKSAENINRILSEFNKTKKLYDEARVQYSTCKAKIDEETKLLEPEKLKIQKELSNMEKDVEGNLLAEYKRKRNDNIFPVIVPLENEKFCGRCRMELAKVALSKLKESGIITCEHCKRFIYNK